MRIKTWCLFLAASLCGIAAGCAAAASETADVDGNEEEITGEAQQAINDPPKGPNHFCAPCFWQDDSQLALRTLGAGAIDLGGGLMPEVTIDAAYRQQILQNVVECALDQGQSVTDPLTNRSYTGHWGLATSWTTGALTASQRRWVTGCMAQRLNAFEKEVEILLEGRHAAIQRDAKYDAEMPWDESTVWGDLFSSTSTLAGDTPPFQLYACSDADLLATCTAGVTPEDWLQYRICDSSPMCGLVTLGPCSAVCWKGPTGYPVCPGPGGNVHETVHVQVYEATCQP